MSNLSNNTTSLQDILEALENKAAGSGTGGEIKLQSKNVSPTESRQIVVADSGYDGLKAVVVTEIPSNYVKVMTTKGETTYTPGTSNQTIFAGTYCEGNQVIKGDSNLVPENIKNGTNIFGVVGEYEGNGIDTSDATATSRDILNGKTAYVKGSKVTGTINSVSSKTITPSTTDQTAVSSGYYTTGSITVKGDSNLISSNIKSGVSIFGVNGSYTGSGSGGDNSKLAPFISGTLLNITAEDLSGATKIRPYAFYSHSSLKSVAIPDSVTSIGSYAFYDCFSLKLATIGNSVTSIDEKAFYNNRFQSIVIPNSVTSIGFLSFSRCNKLISIVIPDSVTSIGEGAFSYCSSLTSVVIGDSVTSISDEAFESCTNLTSLIIGSNIQSIGHRSFYGCSSLTSIEIPANVSSITNYAFYYCSNLKRVDLSTHTSIPTLSSTDAFNNTASNLQIKVPANLIDEWKAATNWSTYADKIVTEFTN